MEKQKKMYLSPALVVAKADSQPLLAGSPYVSAKSWVKADYVGDASEWTTSTSSSSTTASGWSQSTYGDSDVW